MPRPGKFQAIAIMQLVSGCLGAMGLLIAIMSSLGIWLLCITPVFGIVVAVLEIIAGAKGLGNNARENPSFYRTVAILEIINIISCNVPSMVIGILVLVFLKAPEVEAFFAGTWRPPVPQYMIPTYMQQPPTPQYPQPPATPQAPTQPVPYPTVAPVAPSPSPPPAAPAPAAPGVIPDPSPPEPGGPDKPE
ncbi:MAG: hypothetical protein P9M14_11600 [Candidatus Alcyoniella australis]|nr:hypothetical protein [Candidatus Alcyoniella australis]